MENNRFKIKKGTQIDILDFLPEMGDLSPIQDLKEYKIGLFETSSGTGSDHQEIFRYIHTPFQMNKTGVI